MNILAIDTSTKRLCLGLINNQYKILEYNLDSGIRHTELLLPTMKKALRRLRVSLDDIDCFAIGLGPGSFTGLRIGLATIKGFVQARRVPVIGLSSLDVLAINALSENSKIISPVIDAKRNLVYTAWYEVGLNKRLRRRSPYLLISIEELLKKLRAYKSVTFLGDGLRIYQQGLRQRRKDSVFLKEDTWYPRAGNLIKLALDSVSRGRFQDIRRMKPIYLYPKECQIR
jgi:tRNA threonylcarbamoyladenosine biosynthesis protein TsaB